MFTPLNGSVSLRSDVVHTHTHTHTHTHLPNRPCKAFSMDGRKYDIYILHSPG